MQCFPSDFGSITPGLYITKDCGNASVAVGDSVVATMNGGDGNCFDLRDAVAIDGLVRLSFYNECTSFQTLNTATVSAIVFHPT